MRTAAILLLAALLACGGCGGSDDSDTPARPAPGTLEALWRAPGEDVGMVAGTQDYATGRVRVAFLVVDSKGRVVTRPTARIWVSRGLRSRPFAQGTARSELIGPPGHHERGVPRAIFVTHLDLREPGKYWVLAEPVGGRRIQAIGNVVVKPEPDAPAVGERAIASPTPTLADTPLAELSTASKPDEELYRRSIAGALAAGEPFVVVFATPRYCTSRTCGPVVDVVSEVRRRVGGDVRFIHVEVFQDNDPTKGVNRWMRDWRLPSEPWVFLVGSDGRIAERFEGSVSVRELERAVRARLL